MQRNTHYETLGLTPSATEDAIKRAYRKQAMIWHPDRNPAHGAAEAAERFKTIKHAYEVLENAVSRREYDKGLQKPEFRPNSAGAWRREATSAWGSSKQSSSRHKPRGGNRNTNIEISVEMSVRGGTVTISDRAYTRCSICLSGAFRTSANVCPVCKRAGHCVETSTKLAVEVPTGTVEGHILIAKGCGERSPGFADGDLHIEVRLSDPVGWRREGLELRGKLDVDFATALLGGPAQIKLPTGRTLEVSVPPNTDSGSKIRLGSQGLTNRRSREKGDVIVMVRIVLPKRRAHLTDAHKATIRAIASR